MIPPLCFVTDENATMPIVQQAQAAIQGGAGWVQLRHKTLPDKAFAELVQQLIGALAPFSAKLIVNDRIEIARVFPCHGLHIGQSDGDPRVARARIGPNKILGLSVENEAHLTNLPAETVDYLGVGPVRNTSSKSDAAPPIGFKRLRQIASKAVDPCMTIGGLTAGDVPAIKQAKCDGMAVISAISRADVPEEATSRIMKTWSET